MATLAIIIVAAVVVLEGPAARKVFERAQTGRISPEQRKVGERVTVTAGRIPVRDFLRFLSSYSGLPLIQDSTDSNFATREITIEADIEEADDDIVRAILEVNRIRVYRETLPNGKEIIKAEPISPPSRPSPGLKNTAGARDILREVNE